jgi:hypothetical protein
VCIGIEFNVSFSGYFQEGADLILGIFSKKEMSLVFGPHAIRALSRHAHTLVNALKKERVYIDNQGQWQDETSNAYWSYSFFVVALKAALAVDCVEHIERKSGLPFEQFVGQIVLWWLPQRNKLGLIRAIAMRLQAHGVSLTLHWNQGRPILPSYVRPPVDIQIISTLAGFLFGLFAYHQFHLDQIVGFLSAGIGYVGSELYRRSRYHVYCGDALCRSRMRGSVCTFCGGHVRGSYS